MERSQSLCRITTCSLRLAKKLENAVGGGEGGITIWAGRRGEGDEGITMLKTNVILAAAEKKHVFCLVKLNEY